MSATSAQIGDIVLFHFRWVPDGKTMRTRPAIVIWTNGFLCDLHVFWGSDEGDPYYLDEHGRGKPPPTVVNAVTPGDNTISQSWSHRPGIGDIPPEPRYGLH